MIERKEMKDKNKKKVEDEEEKPQEGKRDEEVKGERGKRRQKRRKRKKIRRNMSKGWKKERRRMGKWREGKEDTASIPSPQTNYFVFQHSVYLPRVTRYLLENSG